MPRRSSNKSKGSRYGGYKTTPIRPSPTSTQSQGGIFTGLGQTLKQGMSFGAGSQVAHQILRPYFAPRHQQVQPPSSQKQNKANLCKNQMQNLNKCIKSSSNNLGICQSYLNLLKQCVQPEKKGF